MPIWTDPPAAGRNLFGDSLGEPGPATPFTRFTLSLHWQQQANTGQSPRDSIFSQLWGISGTFLLFLKNLKSIRTTVFDQTAIQFPQERLETPRIRLGPLFGCITLSKLKPQLSTDSGTTSFPTQREIYPRMTIEPTPKPRRTARRTRRRR